MKAKDKTEKRTISASEISKFISCNYQWYYGRKYGNSYLIKQFTRREKEKKGEVKNKYSDSDNEGETNTILTIVALIAAAVGVYYALYYYK